MALINENSKGVYVIGATPFRDDLSLDTEGIAKLTDFYIETGATGFTVLGMMGEAAKLSTAESRAVVEGYIKAAGDLPVVVGVSAGGFSLAIRTDGTVWAWGANGSGQLGHPADTEGDVACSTGPCNPVPKQVQGLPPP